MPSPQIQHQLCLNRPKPFPCHITSIQRLYLDRGPNKSWIVVMPPYFQPLDHPDVLARSGQRMAVAFCGGELVSNVLDFVLVRERRSPVVSRILVVGTFQTTSSRFRPVDCELFFHFQTLEQNCSKCLDAPALPFLIFHQFCISDIPTSWFVGNAPPTDLIHLLIMFDCMSSTVFTHVSALDH